MALIREVLGKTPIMGEDTFLAETAVIIGDVVMGEECSIWYNAVLRGDVNNIRLGDRVNIQDNVTVHCTYEKHATIIGNDVSIGHNAVVHGCEIKNNVLIGMGAIVMDGLSGRVSCCGGGWFGGYAGDTHQGRGAIGRGSRKKDKKCFARPYGV